MLFQYPNSRVILPDPQTTDKFQIEIITGSEEFQYPSSRVILPDHGIFVYFKDKFDWSQYPSSRVILPDPAFVIFLISLLNFLYPVIEISQNAG